MGSRFISLLQDVSLWLVRGIFLGTACVFTICSLLGDHEYGLAIRTSDLRHYLLASQLFPLVRSFRSGPAYFGITANAPASVPLIEQALAHDPYAGDLWYGLARMQLKAGNNVGYIAALTELRRLTPDLNYRVVATHEGD